MKMCVKYKPSCFNHSVFDDRNLLLFNSYSGSKVRIQNEEDIIHIQNLLKQKTIENITNNKYINFLTQIASASWTPAR